jgi:TonB family protein
MRVTLTIVSMFLITRAFPQDELPVRYFDSNQKETTEDLAFFYRRTVYHNLAFEVRDFYASNNLPKMEGTFSQLSPKPKEEGQFNFYHENGRMQMTGEFSAGEKTGIWREYYEDGTPKDETLYFEGEIFYLQHWDEQGKACLTNGTGMYTEKTSIGITFTEVYDSLLRAYANIVNNDTVFVVCEKMAEYRGGTEAFSQGIRNIVRYPKQAIEDRVEGKVFVEFVIDKNGYVRDVHVLQGIGYGCDEEAARVLKQLKNWIPARYKNKPVNQKIVLPISFRLT